MNWNSSTLQFQYCDGTTWQDFGGGGGGGSGAAGSDYNIQYNIGGALTGDGGLTYDGAGEVTISGGAIGLSASGSDHGIYAETYNDYAYAIEGLAGGANGGWGGYFSSGGVSGYGVQAEALAPGGTGVYGGATSANSYGGYFTNSHATGIALAAVATNAATKGLVVKGAASQTGNLAEWQSSTGTVLSYIDAAGAFHGTVSGGGNTPGGPTGTVQFNDSGAFGGANVYYVSSSGNLGIGRTDPEYPLEVNGAIASYLLQPGAFNAVFRNLTNGGAFVNDFTIGGTPTATYLGNYQALPLAFTTNSLERMRIDASGNVGIGTVTPLAPLDVSGAASSMFYLRDSSSGFKIGPSSGMNFIESASAGMTGAADLRFTDMNAANTWMTIGSTGNVGIGTTSPNTKLEVNGIVSATQFQSTGAVPGMVLFNSAGGSDAKFWMPLTVNGNTLTSYIANDANNVGTGYQTVTRSGNSISTISFPNGNVGIGTTTPSYKLDLWGIGNAAYGLRLGSGMNVGGLTRAQLQTFYNLDGQGASALAWNYTGGGGETDWFINRDGGNVGGLKIYDFPNTSGNPTNIFTLEGNGNVGIGSASPAQKLTVAGTIQSTSGGFMFPDGTTLTTGSGAGIWALNGTSAYYNGGNVGIGTSSPATKLDVNGAISIGGTQVIGADPADVWINARVIGNNSATNTDGMFINYNSTGATNSIKLYTPGTTERMRIDSSGNVGIGTTGPSYLLDLKPSTNVAQLRLQQNNATDGFLLWADSAGGNFRLQRLLSGTPTDVFNVLASGNVGIGTTAPGYKMQVQGSMASTIMYDLDNPAYYVDPNGNTNLSTLTLQGNVNCIGGACPANGAMRMTPNFHLNSTGQGSAIILNWDNGNTGANLTLRVGNGAGADVFDVLANGYTGIGGVTAPAYMLHVAGDIYSSGAQRIEGTNPLYFQAYGGGFYMSDGGWIRTYNNKNIWVDVGLLGGNGGLTIGYSGAVPPSGGAIIAGSVGIGTASPAQKLEVVGTVKATAFQGDGSALTGVTAAPAGSSGHVQFNNSGAFGADSGFTYGGSGAVAITAGTAATKPLIVKAAASQSANLQEWQNSSGTVVSSIDSNGYLNLSVNGAAYLNALNGLTFFSNPGKPFVFYPAGVTALVITNTLATFGVPVVMTGFSASGAGTVSGQLNCGDFGGYGIPCSTVGYEISNLWTWYQSYSSDQRLKNKIANLDDPSGLAAIMKLRPVSFLWKDQKRAKEQGAQIGFIAQEVEKIFPGFVFEVAKTSDVQGANGAKETLEHVMGIHYEKLVVPLVKAVQNLKGLFDADHATLLKLKADNDNLRHEIELLRTKIGAR